MNLIKKIGLLVLMSWAGVALASDSSEKVKALAASDKTTRATALQALVDTGDQAWIGVLGDFRMGNLYLMDEAVVVGLEEVYDDDLNEWLMIGDLMSREPLRDEAGAPRKILLEDAECIEPSRKERAHVLTAIMMLELNAPDDDQRLEAVRKAGLGKSNAALLGELNKLSANDAERNVRRAAAESAALLQLRFGDVNQQADALIELGRLRSVRSLSFIESAENLDPAALKKTLSQIKAKERQIKYFNIFKAGISSGSVLVLMALGLAVTFGMMGVINMAHGEMMMIGAYTTYCMQCLFHHTPETPHNLFYVVALPASFLVAALFGGLIETLVVRRLYKRPLESLLATYGVGLILVQITRLIFGDNRPSNSPTWLQGGIELAEGMSLSFNRIYIFLLAIVCVLSVLALMRYTSLGLKMRAVIQNREMAAAMGINTRRTDAFTFMLGSGLAGVAGCALTTIGGITPDMGQNYIVDSFLVVVTGGVGNLAGVVCSGMGLGVLNKFLEGTIVGAVWAKIIVLIAVVAFIQYKPSGLFAPKGRTADD